MSKSVKQILDARGLSCPLPILRAKKAMKSLEPGEVLLVQTTDPAAEKDFIAFAKQTGHDLLQCEAVSGGHEILLQKRG